ncbi:pilus assembly protein TadG-related protein [Desulfosediminicola flagellatus]|uniref:pilus assembly protein TadG-related protein n=1 Tax=Desulfosediminicola flagellatus TaxID=2569541 RepID=UPI0010AD62BF|nr:pilus assembly protein TadG-related protein [Desulfosediminicola flagellatus]
MIIQRINALRNNRGAVAIYVALLLPLLVMIAAIAIDVNHVYGVRNELQNAADAGALAGASDLFDSAGELTVTNAEAAARNLTTANGTGNVQVGTPTVETGHWSFADKVFTPSSNTTQVDWLGRTAQELDTDIDFINAVRVEARRDDTPSFFAKVFGINQLAVANDAVAWIGFAGSLFVDDVDWPIAICQEAITDGNTFRCNMGRMLNSGGNTNTSMTAMWSNYTQGPCQTANNSDMKGLTGGCNAGNDQTLIFGEGMGTQNGVQDNILGNLVDCWIKNADTDEDGVPDVTWSMVLPVIDCFEDNTCSPLVGAVQVNIVWIIHKNDPLMDEVPRKMGDWSCDDTDPYTCWKSFVDNFGLENVSGPPQTQADYEEMYQKKNIFFLTECTKLEPRGTSGGNNFGILADVPVLVE